MNKYLRPAGPLTPVSQKKGETCLDRRVVRATECELTHEFTSVLPAQISVLAAKAAAAGLLENADTGLSAQLSNLGSPFHTTRRRGSLHSRIRPRASTATSVQIRPASHLGVSADRKQAHADLPVHVQAARGHQRNVARRGPAGAERVSHLAALLDIGRQGVERLGLAGQSGGVALGAVLDSDPALLALRSSLL